MRTNRNPHHATVPILRNLTVALLLLGAAMTLTAPVATASGPGSILVVDSGQSVDTQGLTNAGVPQCPSNVAGPNGCWVQVSPTTFGAFTPLDYEDYSILFVGWIPGGATLNALMTQAANIDTWTDNGGSIVAYSEYNVAGSFTPYQWIPDGVTVQIVSQSGQTITPTASGASHPALGGLTSSQLSNWYSSYHNYFTNWPSYLDPLAVTGSGDEVILAGEYGHGCVLITGQDPDWHSANSNTNAQVLVKANIDFAYECGCGHECTPSIELTGTPTHPITDPVGPSRPIYWFTAVSAEGERTTASLQRDLDVEAYPSADPSGALSVDLRASLLRSSTTFAPGSSSSGSESSSAPLSLFSASTATKFGGWAAVAAVATDEDADIEAWTLPTELVPLRFVELSDDHHDDAVSERRDDPWYTGSVVVDINDCNCVLKGYSIGWTVIDDDGDIHGIDEFIGPTVTQTASNPPRFVVSAADYDTYHIDFTVLLDCDGEIVELTKSWYQTN